ncbi:phage tail family protein [Streptomyces gilvifuscus]|uniref:Phage tail family protein n=1 Tax=Streptomyces gilvifuscus TaxID=1550617 RepID=A0ABT5FLJ5_9ACTN|nr:phage tail domain-containing protein [Streptomyces gilvifuscus]MDC2953392.1 phage tail family protein [Streptomyces gilvifuscus]
MPLFVPASGTTTPGGTNPPPIAPLEVPSLSWTDARGRTTFLSDWENGWLLQPGIRGLDLPGYDFYTDASPGIDGNAVRGVRAQAREVFLPVAFFDTSRAAFMTRKRSFLGTLNPRLGLGTLALTEADGSFRTIEAYYVSGAEGSTGENEAGLHWQVVGLTFSCPSPYWLGESVHLEYGAGATGNFFPVSFPVPVRDSQVLGDTVIDNPGDATSYPVWTIHGPMTSAVFTNSTTGLNFSVTASLGSSDVLVVDTRERVQTAVLNGSTNWWPNLATDSDLWGLEPGENDVSLALVGTDSNTVVQLDYQPRFLTA